MHDWNDIICRHGPLVWTVVFRVLNDHAHAADCYQEVFLEVYRQSKDQPVEDWPALLRWVAVRRAIDQLRQRRRQDIRITGTQDEGALVDAAGGPVEHAELNELMDRVCEVVATLPEEQALVFWLRSVEQMSYEQIAARLGLSSNCVGVLLHRARHRLKQSLSTLNPILEEDLQ